ncbi:DUF1835 domain-containing protein [Paenibacillus sp. 1011MAR3C5]|uniref:DUF1835 domain-containing protein n=1 Tax=Paenibacillus sp. 1011MAR3C5 TaxID=1675787 RepID=UPI000E6B983D|nr:DUF1835 domain-containing protein [Paenibacillus sp. 1011MAR3C5]RJE88459.1 DUF1835 domain-containing protein [Paenibacillus sp. 1011MAR3C5]
MMNLDRLKEAISQLSPDEARTHMLHLLLKAEMAKDNPQSKDQLVEDMMNLQEQLVNRAQYGVSSWEPDSSSRYVHIVCGDSFAGSLKLALRKLGLEAEHKIIVLREHYAMGPLWRLHEAVGLARRGEWLRDHINDEYDDRDLYDRAEQVTRQLAAIPHDASIMLWSSGNAYEQTGLRHAAYLIKDMTQACYAIAAAETCYELFNRPDLSIRYVHSGEIPDDKLAEVWKAGVRQQLDAARRSELAREWLELEQTEEVLRIWEQETIQSVPDHYYDDYLMATVEQLHRERGNREFMKAARVIGQALGYCEQYVGDSFLEYRLRELIYRGKLHIKGVPRAMRYYSVRSPAAYAPEAKGPLE